MKLSAPEKEKLKTDNNIFVTNTELSFWVCVCTIIRETEIFDQKVHKST